jgi:hypothetical protein
MGAVLAILRRMGRSLMWMFASRRVPAWQRALIAAERGARKGFRATRIL